MTTPSPTGPRPTPPLSRLLASLPGFAVIGFSAEYLIASFDSGAEEMTGRAAADVVGQESHGLLHDGDLLPTLCKRAGDTPAITETRLTRRGGDLVPVRVSLCRADPGHQPVAWWAFYQDLTENYELRERVLQSANPFASQSPQARQEALFLSELLRHTAENIRIGIAVVEATGGQITYVNEGFEEITGFTVLDAMTQTFDILLTDYPPFRDHIVALIEEVKENPSGEASGVRHWDVEVPTGKRSLETYARLIGIEGFAERFILLIIEDNTERQRLQMQLVQSEKLAGVGQLAAGIAHEIRNPLNTIYNALFDLQEIIEEPSKDVSEDIDISMEEIRRVQDIINNLLDFARETERPRGNADINDVISKTIRLVQHDLSNKGIRVDLDLNPVSEVAMSTNALKQILINLITNGTQAMSRGGVLSIRTCPGGDPGPPAGPAEPRATRFRLARSAHPDAPRIEKGEHVVLQVSDTGTGIPGTILKDIFNPFFTTKEPGAGTGLGLAVVHSLVLDADGAISIESLEGSGTTFTFELPVVPGQ